MQEKLKQVCDVFRIEGTFQSYEEIRVGNVNRTYKVNFRNPDGSPKSYMVQSVNTFVFQNPREVMDNIDKVTEHIRAKKPGRIALHFHHTKERKTYFFDENGFWRLFNYIPSTTYDACHEPEVVHSAGEAFGEFQMMLSDFDARQLYTTIPDFHNTKKRYASLEDHAAADRSGRAEELREELEWLLSVKEKACTLTELHEQGRLPLRVTHNDTKINNVLFERTGSQAIVVIDLDTVMPGLVGYDFGDAIRFAANRVAEDSRDWQRAGVNMEVFRQFTDGFLMHTAAALTDGEVDTLAVSCFVLACEQAVRFLDDYIQGSPYFKTDYPEHNLVRTRCQVALAKDILAHLDEMDQIVHTYAQRYR